MTQFSTVAKALIRFLVIWTVDGLSIYLTTLIFPWFIITTNDTSLFSHLTISFAAAILLGFVNLLIRPVVLLLARPLGFFGVFVMGFLFNAFALMLTARLFPAFTITGALGGFFAALFGGILLAAINLFFTSLLEVNDEGSFYQNRIERQARQNRHPDANSQTRGLVMLEIDGLSYFHLQKVLAEGRMPTMQRLMQEQGYELSHIDCGLPSQTSACQAGILFGDNHDIPAFRWYDKQKQKLFVSGSDAAELNARYTQETALLRDGTSIVNMLNGGASKSLLTMSSLLANDPVERKRRAEDIYLLMLNPYFLTRTVALFLVDVGRELWQGWQQRRRNEWPRLNRLSHGYPFVRAATTVFVRDVAANLVMLDVIRGVPAIYATWPGYDEVAHHSGPWTEDAFKVLETYDEVINRIWRTIRYKAPRPYDLIILSDHGQSYGATFKQRYGLTLKELIEQLLPQGTSVSQSMGGDTGVNSLRGISSELENIQQAQVGNRAGLAVAQQVQSLLQKNATAQEQAENELPDQPTTVTAYGSGNLAQVYFDLYPRKMTLDELEEAYPGMVAALVQHEGLGLVCGYDADGVPVALGKHGRRNLHTGEVSGEDPLLPYAPSDPNHPGHAPLETRIWQVRRIMDFPSAGDLMVISTVYEDGTVAALEELIGNHGGLGGAQTDAFIFHAPDIEVPATRNSIDVFDILNQRRGQLVPPVSPIVPPPTAVEWQPAALWAGITDIRTWVPLALRALVLDRTAYSEIADNPRMTGPGLLLGVGFAALSASLLAQPGQLWLEMVVESVFWLLAMVVVAGAGRVLTRRGYFTRTLRTAGFAHVTAFFSLFTLIPALSWTAQLLTAIVGFVAFWLAMAEAHQSQGWRTFLLPIVAIIGIIITPVIIVTLLTGAALSVEGVLTQLGFWTP
ncbi:MAG: alkaline phosphatase family protein [Anaerolineales bacterium]|nr:alkaline phosphatase family protein [Anaerolineales bacterium]